MGKLAPEELEAEVSKAARLAVASIEDEPTLIAAARAERYQEKLKVRQAREKHLALAMLERPSGGRKGKR